jgi:hypothetical protein
MDERFHVVDDPQGFVRVSIDAPVMNRQLSGDVCREIVQASARIPGSPLLLMDLGAFRRSTPAAGFYAWRQVRKLEPAAVAFHGGSKAMRRFARTVMGFAGFREYGLFDDGASAIAWLLEHRPPA